MEIVSIAQPSMVASNHMWYLNTWHVASTTVRNWTLNLILFNCSLNGHMWLGATILESVDLADLGCKTHKTAIEWTGFDPGSAMEYFVSLIMLLFILMLFLYL